MIKRIYENMVPLLIMAFVQICVAYFFNNQDKKVIIIDDPESNIDSHSCQVFHITNETSNDISGIMLYGDGVTRPEIVYSNIPLEINAKDSKLELSTIYAGKNYVTRICYTNDKSTRDFDAGFSVLNAKSKGFTVMKGTEVITKTKVNWTQIFITTVVALIIYGLFILLMQWHIEKRILVTKDELNSIKQQMNDVKTQYIELKADYEKNVKSSIESNQRSLKHRLLSSKILKDYKKENEFYKVLIQNLINKKSENMDVEYIYDVVRTELRSYSTNNRFELTKESYEIIELFTKDKETT